MHEKPLKNFEESEYNYFAGQNICGVRSVDLSTIHDPAQYQTLYDIGCVFVDLEIVKKIGEKWVLNPSFGDYHDWKQSEEIVNKNCVYLQSLGHFKFI